MRVVGFRHGGHGWWLSALGPRGKPPELLILMPRCPLPRPTPVDFTCRADGRIGPMIELTQSRRHALSRPARCERS